VPIWVAGFFVFAWREISPALNWKHHQQEKGVYPNECKSSTCCTCRFAGCDDDRRSCAVHQSRPADSQKMGLFGKWPAAPDSHQWPPGLARGRPSVAAVRWLEVSARNGNATGEGGEAGTNQKAGKANLTTSKRNVDPLVGWHALGKSVKPQRPARWKHGGRHG